MTTLAIDIGGTKLAAALVEGAVVSSRSECPTPASKTPEALREALRLLIAPLQAQADRVAVASTGIIHQGVLTSINPEKSWRSGGIPAGRHAEGNDCFTGYGHE